MSIHGESLHDSRPDSTSPGNMQELSIFNSLGSMPQIQIPSTHIVDPCDILSLLDIFQDDLV
jgi:hypothetical protein